MRRLARRQFLCESLDSRLLLSTTMIALPAAQIAHTSTSATLIGKRRIQGSVTGKYQNDQASMADAPDTYTLSNATNALGYKVGHKTVTTSTQVDGAVFSTGFVFKGRSTGSIVLKTAGGQVTLDLTGPEQRGFQPPAKRFNYVIRQGSGIGTFANASGTGIVKLDLVRTSDISSLDSGNFRIRFA